MRFNRSVFLSFLLSYLFLIVMVVAIFTVFWFDNFSDEKEKLRSSHENTVLRMCEDVSDQLNRCMTQLDEYLDEKHVKMMINAVRATDINTRENIIFLHQLVCNNVKSQEIYKQISFWFGKINLIISNNGTSEIESYYQVYHSDSFESMDAWTDWISQMKPGRLYACGDGSIYIGSALPLIGTGMRSNAVILELDAQKLFSSFLNAQDLFTGVIEVCDEQGNLLYALGNVEMLDALPEKNLYHFEVRDEANRFILRSIIAEESLFADTSEMIYFYVRVMALCILIGAIISLGMSMRFYQPVRRIANMVGGDKSNENELVHIEQSIQSIIDEREQLNYNLIHHSDDLRECEFRRLISGEINETQAWELIDRELSPGEQGMISFVIVGLEHVKKKQVCKLIETLLGKYMRCRCFMTGHLVAGVAVVGDWNMVKAQMREMYAKMSEVCEDTFCLAVSEIVHAPLALALAHQQALETLDYGMLTSGVGVIFADELPELCDKADSGITLYDHLRLQDAIRSGDADEAMHTFRWITEKYFQCEGVSLPQLKCRMFSLMNTLVTSASEIRSDRQEDPPIEKLLSCRSISDMVHETELYLQAVCSQMRSKALIQAPSLCRDQIVEYIQTHHQDPNLNVASIAEHFHLNASYLSRLFKQTTGEGVLNTIHRVRLMHVEQLLRETDISMHEIQVNTGYPSEQTMFRAFKRIKGMTPSQYRQLCQRNGKYK